MQEKFYEVSGVTADEEVMKLRTYPFLVHSVEEALEVFSYWEAKHKVLCKIVKEVGSKNVVYFKGEDK